MTTYDILKKIKKTRMADLPELAVKLEAIKSRDYPRTLDFFDIEDALKFCIYHFKGGLKESIEDQCSCGCLCESCEAIPENPKGDKYDNIFYAQEN